MAINLEKGKGINLNKGLEELIFTCSWDTKHDVDIHCFVLTNGKGSCDEDFVFYNNLNHPTGAVVHSGDIRDGSKAIGVDDEFITITLKDLPTNKDELVFSASINNAEVHGLHFGKVGNSTAKIIDKATNTVLAQFQLDKDLMGEHVAELARVVKTNGAWRFENLSKPAMSLEGLLTTKGFNVA